MNFAPRRNWPFYEKRVSECEASSFRLLSAAEAFNIYEDFYRTVTQGDSERGDTERLEVQRWKDKLALRRRMIEVLRVLDGERCGDTSSNNTR